MKSRPSPTYQRLPAVALSTALLAAGALAQAQSTPSRTQCKQWDDAYLSVFHGLVGWAFIGTILLCVLLPFLGRYAWPLTSPRRVFWITGLNLVLVALTAVGYPRLLGFGSFVYSGIDRRYVDCGTTRFGAQGLLYGLVGEGLAADAQWLSMLIVLAGAALLGGAVSYAVTRFASAAFGVESRVGGEA